MKKLFILLLIIPFFAIAQERVYNPDAVDPNATNSTQEDPNNGAGVAKDGFGKVCPNCAHSTNIRLENKSTTAGSDSTKKKVPGSVSGDGVE